MRTFYDTFLFIDGLGFLGAGGHCLITWILILFFACVKVIAVIGLIGFVKEEWV